MLSVSIDRSSLSKSALVVGDDPSAALWLQPDGISRVAVQPRYTYATASPFVNGSLLVSTTLDQGQQALALCAQAATTAALYALMDEVDEAFGQFSYTITITEDGVAKTWTCDPASVSWGNFQTALTLARVALATVTIPVYPVAS